MIISCEQSMIIFNSYLVQKCMWSTVASTFLLIELSHRFVRVLAEQRPGVALHMVHMPPRTRNEAFKVGKYDFEKYLKNRVPALKLSPFSVDTDPCGSSGFSTRGALMSSCQS